LWFNSEAEEAARFYVGIFKNSKIDRITHYGKAGPMPEGTVMTVEFKLDGFELVALSGGPEFKQSSREGMRLTVGAPHFTRHLRVPD